MKGRKPISISLGNKYTATFQIINWECSFCGHDNVDHQRMDAYDDLYDQLMYECGLCGNEHLIDKEILK